MESLSHGDCCLYLLNERVIFSLSSFDHTHLGRVILVRELCRVLEDASLYRFFLVLSLLERYSLVVEFLYEILLLFVLILLVKLLLEIIELDASGILLILECLDDALIFQSEGSFCCELIGRRTDLVRFLYLDLSEFVLKIEPRLSLCIEGISLILLGSSILIEQI